VDGKKGRWRRAEEKEWTGKGEKGEKGGREGQDGKRGGVFHFRKEVIIFVQTLKPIE